jgi:ferredoxin-NADP reductase
MIIKKYNSIVTSISNSIPEVYTIEFRSLVGKYKYLPGQFLHLALDAEYDGISQWPESRCFSMQSNQDEVTIRITYAVKGRFTKMMEQQLKVGSEVWLKLPYGDLFSRPHNKVSTVFIAGGTGITPFLSLFTHRSFNEYITPLIYLGFRSGAYNIYKKELDLMKFNDLKIFYEDIEGLIDINRVFEKNSTRSDYFISGPPEMIRIFKASLCEKGLQASNVFTDEWE